MDFALNEQQVILQSAVGSMLSEEFSSQRLHSLIDSNTAAENRTGFDQLELWGLLTDARYGGAGLEMIDAAVVAECIGFAAAPVPIVNHWLATVALSNSSDEAIKFRWLPQLAAGKVLGTVALAEGQERWLPQDWTLRGGNGTLNGEKWFVGDLKNDSLIVVGLEGGQLGIVAPGAAGVEMTRLDGVDRTRPFVRLRFTDTPCTPLDGPDGLSARMIDAALILTAADAFGGARRLLEMTSGYLAEREQFGVRLAQFQGIKHQLANIALEVEPCRALYWYAAHAFDHRLDESAASAALAKAHITDRFLQASRACIELHGGVGFTWEYDAHIWLKRAMFDAASYGSARRHRERYADFAGW